MLPQIVPRFLDQDMSDILTHYLEEEGINVVLGKPITKIIGEDIVKSINELFDKEIQEIMGDFDLNQW